MELMELYNQIKNPLDDDHIIEQLVNIYANSFKSLGGFYGCLTKSTERKYNKGEYFKEYSDYFYSIMFNIWKNNIIKVSKEKFIELYKKGYYGLDFLKMQFFLLDVDDVTTKQEADDIIYGKYDDEELEGALKKYRWDSLGRNSSYVHVCSRNVTAMKDNYPNVEHKLYLNTESIYTHIIVGLLVQIYDEQHMPYYFKFSEYGDRDEIIVIYSSTEDLIKHLDILKEIKNEYPKFFSEILTPPLLTGKIYGWIGYGSEPNNAHDGERHSFNDIRAIVIENSINKITKDWIVKNKNKQIKYKNQIMSFQNYIVTKSAEKLTEKLDKKFKYYEEIERKNAKEIGVSYNSDNVINELGYSINDINSLKFKENVSKVISSRIDNCLNNIYNQNYSSIKDIDMGVRNGKKISFTGYDLESVIRELSVHIPGLDTGYLNDIRSEIKINSKKYGIDITKFCFDVKNVERMKEVDIQVKMKYDNKNDIK